MAEDQVKTNQTLLASHDGLVKLIEHEVVERFAGMSDGVKLYTDHVIAEHERKYHPRSSAAKANK